MQASKTEHGNQSQQFEPNETYIAYMEISEYTYDVGRCKVNTNK